MSSCDVSDVCDELGIAAVRSGALRPMFAGCPPAVGPVTTVRFEPATETESPLDAVLELLARSGGRVVLLDLGGRVDVQCWGTVLASAARRAGVTGALVNGAVRDLEGLAELGLPCYARGVYPGAMRGRLRLAAVNEAVQLDGGTVLAGDVAVVDGSGAVFVAAGGAGQVLAAS